MCGICGELRFDGDAPGPRLARGHVARLARTGTGCQGSHTAGPVALGHRRLSIIDLSARSNQPMRGQGTRPGAGVQRHHLQLPGTARRAARASGYSFFSDGDSEVILKAYAEWGEDCPTRLHGMFAFAVWDSERDSGCFWRATVSASSRCITASHRDRSAFRVDQPGAAGAGEVDTAIDPVALHHHLTLHAVVPAPRTLLRGLRKLAPATA